MGAVVSRWRAKPSTVELLEGIDKDTQTLEEYGEKYQRQLKIWVGRLLLYSSLFFLITCIVVYFWYLPEQLVGRLILSLPFIIFPLLVWLLRKMLIIIFSRRTEKNNDKLEDLKAQKRKILEDVMETETYKNAKMILERFDPDSKRKMELESTPVGPQMTPKPGQEIRHRNVIPRTPLMMVNPASSAAAAARPPLASGPTYPGRVSHSAPGGPPERSLSAIAAQQSLMRRPVTPGTPVPGVGMHPPGPPLARPVLPRDRGAMDRVIEYLVGDGPQNRYALICQQCLSHNGMAIKEEFEYIAFRCAYCYFLNPARKTRPQAPSLPVVAGELKMPSEASFQASDADVDDEQSSLGKSKLTDASAEPDAEEPETPTTAESNPTSDEQSSPESQDVPSEKSDGEQDLSAMEVE
ncbi:endoplasmic reticulum junction formation protein lunapark-A [Hippoglossus hippoglossus]|uniref:endoplasmic reticulum junction formation protein lunapark-A n=1 Tax=Hippoglossus hippoglossus TaxID=8267 RepID=UPI00148DEA33|nr:endoplasmic reticulum junction formation protein lunapark-A [Hippoglossus hippoglossus]XP_034430517.1 endoplasmic reticulum junction formation protein lunapark-A [Hippoglossus hippoglossus]XP_035030176.1 endoplasmic reticulum junction formation protein lunapark-A isoform X1 [Hippoglossus stenolepis]XP_035030178.1 endoplasmic reticulum junction formation protein lunapark-A isoform X1 [Hippoglossus stenolepis]XP_035030179.1 endoplasmic reticulum junction formation protein lunapark-A isoform X1